MTLIRIIFDFLLKCFTAIFRLVDACGRSYTCRLLLS